LNLRQIVELLGLVSMHSPNLIEASAPLSSDALQRYGDISQSRIRNWRVSLDELPRRLSATPAGLRPLIWQQAEVTLVDVLAGGMIARVWGAVLTACDRSRRTVNSERIARTVFTGQLEVQQQVLRLMIDGPYLTLERVSNLDKVRRRIERWTDLLVGHLVKRYALGDFAFDLERALDFGEEQLRESWGPRHHQIWDLYFVCLQSAFPKCRLPGGIDAEWREALLQSILGCFPQDLFLEDGVLKSVRLQRLLKDGQRREGPPTPGRFAGARLAGQPQNGLDDARRERRKDGESGAQ
jgi:hypothetical protein